MDNFANEVDKLLQGARREQEEAEGDIGSHRSEKFARSARRQKNRTKFREDRARSDQIHPTSDNDEVPDSGYREPGSKARDFSGRFVDSVSNSQSLSVTINNSRGQHDSRGFALSDLSRPRGPEFNHFNNSPAWSAPAKSFDYGHGSRNPVQASGPTPSTSRSSSGFPNRPDYPATPQTAVAAAKLAEAATTAQLLKVDILINVGTQKHFAFSLRNHATTLYVSLHHTLICCSDLLLRHHRPSECATTRAKSFAWTGGTATTRWRSRPGCGSSGSKGPTSSFPVPPSRPTTSWPTLRQGEEHGKLIAR